MKILALPGIQVKTGRWADNLLQELAADGRSMQVQHYRHWDCAEGDRCLDLEAEVARLAASEPDLVVGLSLGVMIGLIACARQLISPGRLVLIGTPITSFAEKGLNLADLAKAPGVPSLYIQQKDDLVGSCASLRAALAGVPLIEVVEIPGHNHQYKDLKLLARHIKRML